MSPWWLLAAAVGPAFFFAAGYFVRLCEERARRAEAMLKNRTTGAAEAQQTPGGAERSQELTTTDER